MATRDGIYYNEFFEGSKDRPEDTFDKRPMVSNLTKRDIFIQDGDSRLKWETQAKFYFLPFLINCYKFTRQHKLPRFAIPVSPTMMFYRDRLHMRNYLGTVWQVFFKALETCGVLKDGEEIMLLVEKRFHITDPIGGGSQQLYNMLWDVDLRPNPVKCYVPLKEDGVAKTDFVNHVERTRRIKPTSYNPPPLIPLYESEWTNFRNNMFNPNMPSDGIWLARGTLWLQDDLLHLSKRFALIDEYYQYERDGEDNNTEVIKVYDPGACSLYTVDPDRKNEEHYTEILNLNDVPESKRDLYKPREFYFKILKAIPFEEEEEDDDDDDIISSDSDLIDDFDDLDSSEGLLDSTLDLEAEDEEMNKIIAFFANMPKVTNLVQGMLDMMTGLTNILPLVIQKLDDEKLKTALTRTLDILNKGTDKTLKICRFLGIKVTKKQSNAIKAIVKDRFKKDKKDFIEYEIDELNKTIDALENVDENDKLKHPIHPGDIPPDLTPNNLYPQKMSMHRPHVHLADNHSLKPHIAPIGPECFPHPCPDPVHEFLTQGHHEGCGKKPPCPPPCPPKPPKKEDEKPLDIPSVPPTPPEEPPKNVNGKQ